MGAAAGFCRIIDAAGRRISLSELRRTHYDAASSSRLLGFDNAMDVGLNEALLAEQSILRKRSRFEMRQNGLAKGLGRKYANVLVGRGPRLKMRSRYEAWNQEVEFKFGRWAKTCGYRMGESLAMQVHLGVKQFFPCGEYLAVPRIDPDAPTPVKLRFLMIRPDRLQSPAGTWGEGVETDRDGRPVIYHILRDDPDNQASGFFIPRDFDAVPASLMIHVFVEDDPIQYRAEPWLATALTIFNKLRRVDEGTVNAAEIANKFAAFLKNTMPEFAQDPETLLPSIMELEDGTLTTLPPGYEPAMVKPEHPNTNISEFRRDQLAAAGAGQCMPVNAVTGDSSRHNFASARFDGLMLVTDGEVVRGVIENRDLDRRYGMWQAEATRVGEIPYPPGPYQTEWLWPRNEAHTNPVDSANAAKTRMGNGTSAVGDEVLADGRDDTDHEKRLFEEITRWRAAGMVHPLDAARAAPAAPVDKQPDAAAADQPAAPVAKGKGAAA